jgi:hypothetical protein
LTASTPYWVVLSAPTGEFDWQFTTDNITNANGVAPDGATWFSSTAFPYQMSVVGSTAVPEPASLAGVALAAIALRRRRTVPRAV